MKGELIMTGVGMDMMMKICYANNWTKDNTIIEWELNKDMPSEDRWFIYEKQLNNNNNDTRETTYESK